MNLQKLDQTYVMGTYRRFPVEVVSGKGSIVKDTDGKTYIDMGSGIGVTALGIANDGWIEAVTAQLHQVQHTSNLYYTNPCAQLAKMLCERTGMKKVFFSNSGAEANECAIKAARKYAAQAKGSDCFTIATLVNSFHGRTLTTLAATGQTHYHELFQPLTPGFVSVAANLEEIQTANEKTPLAAVMIECIQGEGGVIPLDESFVRALRAYTEENNILLIVDEVQTGNGRTGDLYAYMHYGIRPDLVTTAKGLSGGLPLGATLFGEKTKQTLGFGDHGSTFGGNPVCCAAGCYVLSQLDDAFLSQVKEKSSLLYRLFTGAEGIESITGRGLMLGLKTTKPAADVVDACLAHGVLCLTAKDKVRLLPALNIPFNLLEEAANVILDACKLK